MGRLPRFLIAPCAPEPLSIRGNNFSLSPGEPRGSPGGAPGERAGVRAGFPRPMVQLPGSWAINVYMTTNAMFSRRCLGSRRRSRGATLDISQLRSGWARPKEIVRPVGTPDFRRPVRTDSVLNQPPGTSCRANFPCRFATTEMRCDSPTHHHRHETIFHPCPQKT